MTTASIPRVKARPTIDASAPVVVLSPEPRWRRRLCCLLLVLAFVLTAVAGFRVGQRFPVAPRSAAAVAAAPVAAPAVAPSPPADADDGLVLEHFSFRQESPRLGRYRFAAVNAGREFRGGIQFHIEGEHRPDPDRPSLRTVRMVEGPAGLRIRRRLNSDGALGLEEEIQVRRVEIRLIQDGVVRARRAVIPLSEAGG